MGKRRKRLRKIARIIAPILTEHSQRRMQASIEDAISKVIAAGNGEQLAQISPSINQKANEFARDHNAKAIYEWARAIQKELEA